jgi:hypothetical protein
MPRKKENPYLLALTLRVIRWWSWKTVLSGEEKEGLCGLPRSMLRFKRMLN